MISLILGDVMIKSIINIFSNNLLIDTPFSLIITNLNLVSNSSRGLVSIKLSYIRFYFKLYVLKLPINIIFSVMILF